MGAAEVPQLRQRAAAIAATSAAVGVRPPAALGAKVVEHLECTSRFHLNQHKSQHETDNMSNTTILYRTANLTGCKLLSDLAPPRTAHAVAS